jgi:hypothetical protein
MTRTGRCRHLVAAACSVLLLVACADSGYQYVSNSDEGAYFKVPDDWELFDLADVEPDGPSDRVEPAGNGVTGWRIVFDASPDPSVEHLSDISPNHPVGIAQVAPIPTADFRDNVDLAVLRSLALGGRADPVALARDRDPNIELLAFDDITTEEGFRGSHIVMNVRLPDGKFRTVDHVALVDPATTKMYQFLVMCSSSCYRDNQDEIERIVASWQIRKD